MLKCVTDFETWALDNSDRLFSYQTYRKLFTPYEQENRFIGETQFEEGGYYSNGYIEELIDLGNGDWLIGFRDVIDDEVTQSISYRRLSEIQLSFHQHDEQEDD